MKLKTFLIINAVLLELYGIFMLLFPEKFGSYYFFSPGPELPFGVRLLGVYLVAAGLLSWSTRNAPPSKARTNILYAFLAMNVLGLLVALIYQLNYTVDNLGWSTVIIYLVLAVGFAYYLYGKPKAGKKTKRQL
jgi:hypothetical protein